MDNKLFYKNLRYLRKVNHLTQEEMGKRLGICRSTYAYVEKRGAALKITSDLREIIFEKFGYTLDELMSIDLETEKSKHNSQLLEEINSAITALTRIKAQLIKRQNK